MTSYTTVVEKETFSLYDQLEIVSEAGMMMSIAQWA